MQIFAPWTPEQVNKLRQRQRKSHLHPYTCECGAVLFPTTEGWKCPDCLYRQQWAHEVDTL